MDPMMTTAVTVAIVIVSLVVFVLVFRWIWNHTVPAVFGLKEITFWQAVGILILASILTGGHRVISTDITNLPKRVGSASTCRTQGFWPFVMFPRKVTPADRKRSKMLVCRRSARACNFAVWPGPREAA